jgi:hypothetical protein
MATVEKSEAQSSPKPVADLHIFVNRKKFDEGITPVMTVDAIAQLVDLTGDTATVRRGTGGKDSLPLEGSIEIHQADHFVVTRKAVEGGDGSVLERIRADIDKLLVSGAKVTLVQSPLAVIYHDLPTADGAPEAITDVLVPIPSGYAAAMMDLAFLPVGSKLIGRVKGQPQEVRIVADGRTWQQISYHPHNGGGGPRWNPNRHGVHTYVDEVIAWLGCLR